MKKILLLTAGIILMAHTVATAQPFTPTMAADTYGIAQGGVNNGIPTPRDNNDNPVGPPPIPLDINDAINRLLGTSFARNKDVDHLRFLGDDVTWFRGNNTDAIVILVGGTAARTNTLRVYDTANPGVKIPLVTFGPIFSYTGDGLTNATPYLAAVNPLAPGTSFGWSLFTQGAGPNETWDSDPSQNLNNLDHLLAYQLNALAGQTRFIQIGQNVQQYTFNNPFLLTWEDQRLANGVLGDEDYDDLMYLVTRVTPTRNVIPEPMSMSLLGTGLLGMIAFKRRK